jgi:betaine reductase
MVVHQGTTQTTERRLSPDSEHLKNIAAHLRDFDACVAYPPNQAYIGAIRPKVLESIARPWYDHPMENAARRAKHGEIMPEEEFYGLMKAVDSFDLVILEESYQARVAELLANHPVVSRWKSLEKLQKNPGKMDDIAAMVETHAAEPMYLRGELVGCVRKAHDFDAALSEHVMFENLVSKASGAFALSLLIHLGEVKAEEIEYIIECSEEACGDMNQRGGGNFAKSIGEIAGCVNATGSDTRSFCAGPAHAMVEAAALEQAGVYKHVVVRAGGSSAKLGLNAKDHVKKGLPVLEDCLGAFAVHIGENDGVSPIIRTDAVGRHTIGSGASPQAVMQAIVAAPLDRVGIPLSAVDTFSVEMQNPEITEPAGAGDVPKANYKMIAALGVMRKDFEKSQLNDVVARIAMPGFAPTQGHIPSGAPFMAHCRDMMADGQLSRAMIVGKGSLFLGRLTNLFDGVSFLVEKNPGKAEERGGTDKETLRLMVADALAAFAAGLRAEQEGGHGG